jgi:hypothetical protein
MTDSIDHGSAQGEPGTPSPRPGVSARIVEPTQRITIGGVETSTAFDRASGNTSDLTPRDGNQGILSTARSISGRVLTGADVKPTTTLLVGGVETSVAAACTMGLLQRGSDGTYSEVAGALDEASGAEGQDSQEQQQEASPAKLADLPQEAHSIAEQFVTLAGNVDIARGLSQVIESGAMSDDLVTSVAGAMGLEPGEVHARAATLRAAYETQAREMMGPNADAIIAYGNSSDRTTFRKAVDDHVQNENPDAYQALVRNYWLNLDRMDPNAIFTAQNADKLQPKKERDGTITVNIPGAGRLSWGAAVRAGFIGGKR